MSKKRKELTVRIINPDNIDLEARATKLIAEMYLSGKLDKGLKELMLRKGVQA